VTSRIPAPGRPAHLGSGGEIGVPQVESSDLAQPCSPPGRPCWRPTQGDRGGKKMPTLDSTVTVPESSIDIRVMDLLPPSLHTMQRRPVPDGSHQRLVTVCQRLHWQITSPARTGLKLHHRTSSGWSPNDRHRVAGSLDELPPHRLHSTRCPSTRAQNGDLVISGDVCIHCDGFIPSVLAAVEARREFC
jgi:hypothetical protein